MIYRKHCFLTVVWLGSTPNPVPPSPVSKLSLFLRFPVCRRSSLLTGEGGRRWAWSQIIQPRGSLALYIFNTLWGEGCCFGNVTVYVTQRVYTTVSVLHKYVFLPPPREYWMINRGPGFRAVVCFGSSPPPLPLISVLHKYVFLPPREYWMIYRGPGFRAVVWFGSSPSPRYSKLGRRHIGKLSKRDNLLTGEGEGQVRRVLCISFNTLCFPPPPLVRENWWCLWACHVGLHHGLGLRPLGIHGVGHGVQKPPNHLVTGWPVHNCGVWTM